MKKKIVLGILALIVIVAAVAVIVIATRLNDLVKAGVEAAGPKATGTAVTLESVSLNPLSGSGKLGGLVIGNPEGFKTPSAFSLNEVALKVDIGSITSDTIVIEEVSIKAPEITYELSLSGSNLGAIMEHIESQIPESDGSDPEPEPTADDEAGKSILIKKFVLEGATVNLSATILQGEAVSLTLPTIELNDIGGKDKDQAETVKELYGAILKAIEEAVAESGQLGTGALDGVKEAAGGVIDGVKGLFGGGDK